MIPHIIPYIVRFWSQSFKLRLSCIYEFEGLFFHLSIRRLQGKTDFVMIQKTRKFQMVII